MARAKPTRRVCMRLAGADRHAAPAALAQQLDALTALVRSTVGGGAGCSVLVSGPRGAGKTLLVRAALSACAALGTFRIVILSGLVHTDDRSALRDIVRQLNAAADGVNDSQNDKITADLLADLNDPDEDVDHDPDSDPDQNFGSKLNLDESSFAATLASVLAYIHRGNRENCPIVFVLEEFDLFGQHAKQMLLYNLLDMAQTPGIPVCVIGTTCRVDCLDILEKRVKSRFSHRIIHVPLPESFNAYLDIVSSALLLNPDSDKDLVHADNVLVEAHNTITTRCFLTNDSVLAFLRAEYSLTRCVRPAFVQLLKGMRSLRIVIPEDLVHQTASLKKDTPEFINAVDRIVEATLTENDIALRAFWESSRRIYRQAESLGTRQLISLSQLELVILAATFHFYQNEVELFNFEMTYDKYKELILRHSKQNDLLYVRPVALRAFEQLQNVNAIHVAESATKKCPREYRMFRLACYPFQIEQALKTSELSWALTI